MGEICPRSDPDIAHMRYYLDPLNMRTKAFGALQTRLILIMMSLPEPPASSRIFDNPV